MKLRLAATAAAALILGCTTVSRLSVHRAVDAALQEDVSWYMGTVRADREMGYASLDTDAERALGAAAAAAGIHFEQDDTRHQVWYSVDLEAHERSFSRGMDSLYSITCVVDIRVMPEGTLLARSFLALETPHTIASAPRLYDVVKRGFVAALSGVRR